MQNKSFGVQTMHCMHRCERGPASDFVLGAVPCHAMPRHAVPIHQWKRLAAWPVAVGVVWHAATTAVQPVPGAVLPGF